MFSYLLAQILTICLVSSFCEGSVGCQHKIKVLDFSLDSDWKPDANNIYTHASLKKENLPSTFTICCAFMVEKWGTFVNSPLFLLLDSQNDTWLYVELYASDTYTEFTIHLPNEGFATRSLSIFFPMRWARICFSFNSNTSVATLVVDGEQLVEKKVVVGSIPPNLNMILGEYGDGESPGRMTDVNVFWHSLSNMEEMTRAGTEKCGAPGDFVNWDKTDWVLHSKARVIHVDSSRGPCRRQSKMQVYPMEDMHGHSDCMQHCEKLGGRAPSVRTFEEWKAFSEEVESLIVEPEKLWLSATEGDKNNHLSHLDHWPKEIDAGEGVWRDFFTGVEIDNYTKPWESSTEDSERGIGFNCIYYHHSQRTWKEWQCKQPLGRGCPCIYKTRPVLNLRG